MLNVSLAVVLLSVAVPGETVMLDFTAPWCGPCRSMEPTVAQLTAQGYPIRKVDIDREPDLARQYQITSIPCFVLVSNGQEVDRIVGPASADELQGLMAKASRAPARSARGDVQLRGQSPDEPLQRIASNSPGHQRLLAETGASAQTFPVSGPSQDAANPFRQARSLAPAHQAVSPPAAAQAGNASQDFIQYAARLKIEDKDGFSYGTGTIIDVRQDQALILTCGHIFRDSGGQGTITVDLFVPGAARQLPARVVSYDLTRDVGLVSVRPGVPVRPARVAPAGYRHQVGDRVITVGCNNGGEPTVVASEIIGVDKFVGPPNVQVAGQPVQGRSGGGLFTLDGMVVGVCNAADPADNAGLFAAAAAVHQELDSARLSSIYRNAQPQGEQLVEVGSEPQHEVIRGNSPSAEDLRRMAQRGAMAGPSASEQATLASLDQHGDAEVICIIRPRGQANARSEVVVLDRVSASFMEQLHAERDSHQARKYTTSRSPATEDRSNLWHAGMDR